MTTRVKILSSILLVLCLVIGTYHGINLYTSYDNNKIKVNAGDCLASNPTPAGLDFFIYVHKINEPKKWVFFYYIDPSSGGFAAAASVEVFNKRMDKHNTKFVDCKTLEILRSF